METGPPRFFHAASGKELATLEAPRNFGGAGGAHFSPDGTWLAVATGNHTVHLWDLRAIRRGLAELDLDWELPSYPPPVSKGEVKTVRLEVPGEVAQFLKVRDGFLLGQEQALSKEWQAAIESFSKVIERDKTYYEAYNERGKAYAELKQWREAEADFGKAAELAPDQSGVWYSRALVCLARDDIDAYKKICATMLDRFGQTPQADDAYWMAWTCAVRPDSAVEPALSVGLAERFVDEATPGVDDLVVLGAALYRAGRFKDAVGRLQDAALAHQAGREGRQTIVYAWIYLAMAEHRLGRSEAARKWLDRAADSVAKRDVKGGAEGAHSDASLAEGRGSWNRRLTLQLLRNEAEAVLKQPY
jgi:tetratricopeptide (TPR) repeat protein